MRLRSTLVVSALASFAFACGSNGGDDDSVLGAGGAQATGGSLASGGGGSIGTPATGGAPATGSGSAGSGGSGGSTTGSGGSGNPAPADAGHDAAIDGGAMRDAGRDAGALSPQDLPSSLTATGIIALYPAPGATQVCPDPPLRIVFSGAPALGSAGKLQVFDAAQPGVAVASFDMAQSSTSVEVDGDSYNQARRAYVDDDVIAMYLPPHALGYGHEYIVHFEAGMFTAPDGSSTSVSDDATWRFTTAGAAPSDTHTLHVALDGRGDFCTVQGAIDATSGDSDIMIARGTYHEIIHFRAKDRMRFHGADRKATIVAGTNNEKLNGGTAKRALVAVDASAEVSFEDLTIQNLTPQDGSQAEALRMQTCDRCSVRNADIVSLQDTLLWSGRVYARDCYIAGNVDFIWGTGTVYFEQCEIKTLGRKGYNVQARNGAGAYGYVFVDSKLTSDPGITGSLLGRVDSSVYPASHVAYVDCEMGSHIAPVGWQVTGGGTSQLRFWEYGSKTPDGAAVDVGQRLFGSKQLTSDQAAMMRDKSVVLGGWNPD